MTDSSFEDILIYFSKSLLGKESEDEILWDLAKNCIAKLGFVDCVIYLLDEENKFLIQKAAYGPKNPKDYKLYNPVKIMVGEGITGHVATTGIPELVKDTSKDPRYIEDDAARLSEICVPITHENTIYGVIDCEHPNEGFFTKHHLRMLSAVASVCAIKIKSVRADKKLREKQEKLFRVKEEMAQLKLKALSSQLNPHFIFNSLNAIQYFITSENKKKAMEYLSLFSNLIRFYLKNLNKDTCLLSDEIDMLRNYFKLQNLRYDDSFEYTISINSDSRNPMEVIIPSFVLQTLFENIIEQSMFNQQSNQRFEVLFNVMDNRIGLEIQYKSSKSNHNIKPDYREEILNWQEQIDLLNNVKGFGITYNINSTKKDGVHREMISLFLPSCSKHP